MCVQTKTLPQVILRQRLLLYQISTLVTKYPLKNKVFVQYLFGGGDGNRTRVRKPFPENFSERSRSFKIPSFPCRAAGRKTRQPLIHKPVRGACRLTFTANRRLYPDRGTSGKDGCLIKQRRQQYCCRLILKLRRLKRVRNAARLSRCRAPVEAFTPPNIRRKAFGGFIISYSL